MWQSLEIRAKGSFFTSWTWIGAWIDTYAAQARSRSHCRLLVAQRGDKILALAILCLAPRQRRLLARVNTVLLHQTGGADDASAFIEYNGFLVDESAARDVSAALLRFVADDSVLSVGEWAWTEFRVSGADDQMAQALHLSALSYRVAQESACPWVDLRTISLGLSGYLARLSSNTRGQVRRAVRLYEKSGALAVTVARTIDDAHLYLKELRKLHEDAWRRRTGTLGAFSFPLFHTFTAALVERGHASGVVDLLRVTAGDTTIGVLLNFVHGGHVYAYQSGFAYGGDNRMKPGLVSHALAIAHYRSQSLEGYHFMAGEGRHKTSLATATESLTWIILRRKGLASRLEDSLRAFKAYLTQK